MGSDASACAAEEEAGENRPDIGNMVLDIDAQGVAMCRTGLPRR
ncbi:hypothetical protein [Nocardia sp. NPDC004860]